MFLKAFMVFSFMVAAVVSTIFLAPSLFRKDCVPLGNRCSMKSDCCNTLKHGGIGLRLITAECFIFGDSTCQTIDKIPNLADFFKLRKLLNRTNFEALRDEYWNFVR